MSRRMVSQQDQDYIKVLRTAVDADEEGNVEVEKNLHIGKDLNVEGNLLQAGKPFSGGDSLYIHKYICTSGGSSYILQFVDNKSTEYSTSGNILNAAGNSLYIYKFSVNGSACFPMCWAFKNNTFYIRIYAVSGGTTVDYTLTTSDTLSSQGVIKY